MSNPSGKQSVAQRMVSRCELERRVARTQSPVRSGVGGVLPPVLDACCGSRMFWFDVNDPRALFVDKRREEWPVDIGTPGTVGRSPIVVNPDVLADFTDLPFPDCSFPLVVFDPPHVARRQGTGIIDKKYGFLEGDWRIMLAGGFAECFRVLKPHGTLVFKWAETDIPLTEVLALTEEKPLFGHRSGKKLGTHWCVFLKGGGGERLKEESYEKIVMSRQVKEIVSSSENMLREHARISHDLETQTRLAGKFLANNLRLKEMLKCDHDFCQVADDGSEFCPKCGMEKPQA